MNETEDEADKNNKKIDTSARKGLTFALTSGVCAALAGSFGKLAMTSTETVWICEVVSEYFSNLLQSNTYNYMFCNQASFYLQILCFIAMIIMNGIMVTTFVKALNHCKTSLEATVTNTAANFFASALVGQLVFGESVSIFWWLGTLLIIFGLALMNYSQHGGCIKGGTFKIKKNKSR